MQCVKYLVQGLAHVESQKVGAVIIVITFFEHSSELPLTIQKPSLVPQMYKHSLGGPGPAHGLYGHNFIPYQACSLLTPLSCEGSLHPFHTSPLSPSSCCSYLGCPPSCLLPSRDSSRATSLGTPSLAPTMLCEMLGFCLEVGLSPLAHLAWCPWWNPSRCGKLVLMDGLGFVVGVLE